MPPEEFPLPSKRPEDNVKTSSTPITEPTSAAEINALLDDPLAHRNRTIHKEAIATLELRKQAASERELLAYEEYTLPALEAELRQTLDAAGFDSSTFRLSIPPSNLQSKLKGVDLAWNAISLARASGQPVPEVTKRVAATLEQHPLIDRVTAAGPFLNMTLNWQAIYGPLSGQIKNLSSSYGHSSEGTGQTVAFDFSSPNVAKNMTLAHLRSTVIGRAISKLYEANGYTAFRINHLGDWGTQFGQLIYQWQEEMERDPEGFQKQLDEDAVGTRMRAYRRFHERLDEEPELEEKAQELFLRLEKGDPDLLDKWQTTLDVSLREFQRMYKRLDVEFDTYQGESFYRDLMDEPVQEAVDKRVLVKASNGAIEFPGQALTDPDTGKASDANMKKRGEDGQETDELKPELVVKPTGGTVYLTRDLAAIRYRSQVLDADQIRYIIGKEQARHCLILFNMADQLGYSEIGTSRHISFGHLNIDGKKAKSRKGTVILLDDILNESVESAAATIKRSKTQREDDSNLSDQELETAEVIGVGSVVYNDLRQDRRKDIKFDPETAGQVMVGGAPYLQYTFARLSGILRKLDDLPEEVELPESLSYMERGLMLRIALFPQVLSEACEFEAPHKIATYLEELAQQANRFYETHHVGRANPTERQFRQRLIQQLQQVFKNAADILGIGMPEQI